MSDGTLLVLLLVVLGLPAFLIARSARKVGEGHRRAEQLRTWAALRGWSYRGQDPALVGAWQVAPFTEPERWVDDALSGEHRGRAATSFRLEVPGQGTSVFHVLTLAIDPPVRPVQLATADGPVSDDADVRARLTEPDGAGMAVRAVRGDLVAWTAGEPILGDLPERLDVLADVAELLGR